jgi:hypothetical protein
MLWAGLLLGLGGAAVGCGSDGERVTPPPSLPGDPTTPTTPTPPTTPGRTGNGTGPTITFVSPAASANVPGDQLRVQFRAEDTDGVDTATAKVEVAGVDGAVTAGALGNGLFEANVTLTGLASGNLKLTARASDTAGEKGSAELTIFRDAGPTIQIITPAANGIFRDAAPVRVKVTDVAPRTVTVATLGASVAGVVIALTPVSGSADEYQGQINATDQQVFSPPLLGAQLLRVTVTNDQGTVATVQQSFTFDRAGPTLTPVAPIASELIGGITRIAVDVQDGAGVAAGSVIAVVSNGAIAAPTINLTRVGTSNVYEALFDTRRLPSTFVFPSLSFRASDAVGNENAIGFQIAVDNQPPAIELDPPVMQITKKETSNFKCSVPFDPLGDESVNDGETRQQIFETRVRVDDRGNAATGQPFTIVGGVDPASVELYVLDDTARPLTVDTDGDGICDDINPELKPTTQPNTSNEVLLLTMAKVDPRGSAYFPPAGPPPVGYTLANDPNAVCTLQGNDTTPPETICDVTSLSIVIPSRSDQSTAAVYTLPTVQPTSRLQCLGFPLDSTSNHIADGPVCIAVRAKDKVGNLSVSRPLRVCVNHDGVGSECTGFAGALPNCTGTVNPANGQVSTTACTPRPGFAAGEVMLLR